MICELYSLLGVKIRIITRIIGELPLSGRARKAITINIIFRHIFLFLVLEKQ